MTSIRQVTMPIIIVCMLLAVGAKAQSDSVLPYIWEKPFSGQALGMEFSPDSRFLMCYKDSATSIFEAATGKEIITFAGESIARFTPDGLYLTTAKNNCLIRRKVGTWEIKDTVKFDFPITLAYEYSPDATKLAIADNDTFNYDMKHNFKIYVYNTKDWSIEYNKNYTEYLSYKPYPKDTLYREYIRAHYFNFSRDSKFLIYEVKGYRNTKYKGHGDNPYRGVFFDGYTSIVVNLNNKKEYFVGDMKGDLFYTGIYQFSPKYDKLYCLKANEERTADAKTYDCIGYINIDYNSNSKDSSDFIIKTESFLPKNRLGVYLEESPTILNYLEDEKITISGICYNVFRIYAINNYDCIFDNYNANIQCCAPLTKVSKNNKYISQVCGSIKVYNLDVLFKSGVTENNSLVTGKYLSDKNSILLSGFDKNVYLSSYKILDISGKELYNNDNAENFRTGDSSYLIPVKSIPDGVYILNYKTNKGIYSIKFIIER